MGQSWLVYKAMVDAVGSVMAAERGPCAQSLGCPVYLHHPVSIEG